MTNDRRNDLAARRARWKRIYEALPAEARAAHDAEKARRRAARQQAEETRLRERVDKAVAEALAVAVPRALAGAAAEAAGITEAVLGDLNADERAELAAAYWGPRLPPIQRATAVEMAEPATPLHEMTDEQWAEHRLKYWSQTLPQHASSPNVAFLMHGFKTGAADSGES